MTRLRTTTNALLALIKKLVCVLLPPSGFSPMRMDVEDVQDGVESFRGRVVELKQDDVG